jgi:hypothetical protein
MDITNAEQTLIAKGIQAMRERDGLVTAILAAADGLE